MEIYTTVIGHDGLWLNNYLFIFILLRAAWNAPWRSFFGNTKQFNLFIGLSLWLGMLWFFPVGAREVLKLHALGATLCFLIFDWQIATLMLSLVLLLSMWYGKTTPLLFGSIGLVMIVLPMLTSWLGLKLFYRYGKPNYFGFVIWNGYVVSGAAMLLSALVNGWIIEASGKLSQFTMDNSYWSALSTLISMESLLTGLLISGLAVSMQNTLVHFDWDVYFVKPPKPPIA